MSIFDSLDELAKKAEASKGPLKYQSAALQALGTFARRPPNTTRNKPHMRDAVDLKRFMLIVVVSLLPCLFFGMYNVGRGAYMSIGISNFSVMQAMLEGALHVMPLVVISYAVGGFFEMLFAQFRGHQIAEGFLVTGMLYPLVCPVTVPYWMYALGIIFGVVIGKEVFGGTGQNIFNPTLVARAFLFFAYPAHMSGEVWIAKPYAKNPAGVMEPNWFTTIATHKIQGFLEVGAKAIDGYSGETALAIASQNIAGVDAVAKLYGTFSKADMFFGFMPGSIGETSTLMCLLGAALLALTGVGSWRTIAGVAAGGVVTALLFNLGTSPTLPSIFALTPFDHLTMGGFAFGAIFMATEPVSGPLHSRSKLIYGFLIGMLCVMIRAINPAFPEGMMLAILFMNIFSALIDHYVQKAANKRRVPRAY